MSSELSQIFRNIPELEPNTKLADLVLAKIDRKRSKIIREKKALAWFGLFSSAIAIVYTLSVFGQEILRSDFWRIVSLAFSDMNIITGNWYDYAFSLLETFPAMHAAIMLAPIFILLILLNAYFDLINKYNRRHI